MLEHTNELEPTMWEINAINKLMNCSPKEQAEDLIKEFKTLGLSEITATACALKVCNTVLENTMHNYFRQEHWKEVREILFYQPLGTTEKIF